MRKRYSGTPANPSQAIDAGFSLIEITIALAIAAVAMVAILGMLPGALKSGRDAVDQTAIGTVLEDVHERLEGQALKEGALEGSPFFYDQQGRFWSSDQDRPNSIVEARFIRADVSLVKPADPPASAASAGLPTELLAARVSLSWPLNDAGEAVGRFNPRTTVTYMVTTLTGADWPDIDPDYVPKVEY